MHLRYNDCKIMYKHIRHPFNPSRLIGTVACLEYAGILHIGFSQCHPNDQFSKKEGREIAADCAYKGIEKHEVSFIAYRPDGSKQKRYLVRKAIDDLAHRAKRLWGHNKIRTNYVEPKASLLPILVDFFKV